MAVTYQEIWGIDSSKKGSWHHLHTQYTDYGRFCVCKTRKGECFLVDTDMAEQIYQHLWCVDGHGYLCARIEGRLMRLHDFVLAKNNLVKPKGYYVDHVNQDKLDNRRTNLRIVAPKENSKNVSLKANNTSGITGVSCTKNGTYRAYITTNHKQINLGYYPTIQEAAQARMEAETRLGFKTRPTNIKELCELEGADVNANC